VMIDNYHLFFACQDNPSYILKVNITLPDYPGAAIEVPARPIWYDRDKESKEKKALLGVEFLLKPKDKAIERLVQELSEAGSTPTSWWQKKIF